MSQENPGGGAAEARAKHRFLVRGLVFVGVLAAVVGILVGLLKPEPRWPLPKRTGGVSLEQH